MKYLLPRSQKRTNVFLVIVFVVIHLVGLGAPFLFPSWAGVILCIALWQCTGTLGITIGFHRLLTHRSFETKPWLRNILAFIGTLAWEGSALKWVADHRVHHRHSDKEGDPHSPKDSFWYGHDLWIFETWPSYLMGKYIKDNAPDLWGDPCLRFMHHHYLKLNLASLAVIALAGFLYGGWYYALSFATFGFFTRIVLVWHFTWLVNSASHRWGYRNYETPDNSRNNWGVALVTNGEGWHNNHHKSQQLAVHGHRPWEIDVTYRIILLMRYCKLVWNVKDTLPAPSNSS